MGALACIPVGRYSIALSGAARRSRDQRPRRALFVISRRFGWPASLRLGEVFVPRSRVARLRGSRSAWRLDRRVATCFLGWASTAWSRAFLSARAALRSRRAPSRSFSAVLRPALLAPFRHLQHPALTVIILYPVLATVLIWLEPTGGNLGCSRRGRQWKSPRRLAGRDCGESSDLRRRHHRRAAARRSLAKHRRLPRRWFH